MNDAAQALQLYDPAGRGDLALIGADLVVWTGEQVARAELLALILAALLLLLLGLNLWLLVDRARRRRAGRELFARLAVLETDRALAQMAAAGGAAAPRRSGVIPLRPEEGRPPFPRSVGEDRVECGREPAPGEQTEPRPAAAMEAPGRPTPPRHLRPWSVG